MRRAVAQKLTQDTDWLGKNKLSRVTIHRPDSKCTVAPWHLLTNWFFFVFCFVMVTFFIPSRRVNSRSLSFSETENTQSETWHCYSGITAEQWIPPSHGREINKHNEVLCEGECIMKHRVDRTMLSMTWALEITTLTCTLILDYSYHSIYNLMHHLRWKSPLDFPK